MIEFCKLSRWFQGGCWMRRWRKKNGDGKSLDGGFNEMHMNEETFEYFHHGKFVNLKSILLIELDGMSSSATWISSTRVSTLVLVPLCSTYLNQTFVTPGWLVGCLLEFLFLLFLLFSWFKNKIRLTFIPSQSFFLFPLLFFFFILVFSV